ncbi:hypothetical protein C8J57DRAFT_1523319 [Mycena rebaudengoi]|nr:hypothetical protein C8J57DRAFT_1523319 [Mycena rebaudengoi]
MSMYWSTDLQDNFFVLHAYLVSIPEGNVFTLIDWRKGKQAILTYKTGPTDDVCPMMSVTHIADLQDSRPHQQVLAATAHSLQPGRLGLDPLDSDFAMAWEERDAMINSELPRVQTMHNALAVQAVDHRRSFNTDESARTSELLANMGKHFLTTTAATTMTQRASVPVSIRIPRHLLRSSLRWTRTRRYSSRCGTFAANLSPENLSAAAPFSESCDARWPPARTATEYLTRIPDTCLAPLLLAVPDWRNWSRKYKSTYLVYISLSPPACLDADPAYQSTLSRSRSLVQTSRDTSTSRNPRLRQRAGTGAAFFARRVASTHRAIPHRHLQLRCPPRSNPRYTLAQLSSPRTWVSSIHFNAPAFLSYNYSRPRGTTTGAAQAASAPQDPCPQR